jgi:hypothetical protein
MKKNCKLLHTLRRRPDKKEVIDMMTLSSVMAVVVEDGSPKWVDWIFGARSNTQQPCAV